MRKASTRLPEQGTQTPSPAPDLIPAKTKNQSRTHIAIGTANGGTSPTIRSGSKSTQVLKVCRPMQGGTGQIEGRRRAVFRRLFCDAIRFVAGHAGARW